MTGAVRILIVDDHPVVLFGLRLIFSETTDRLVVGAALNQTTAKQLMLSAQPDIVILDLVMGGRDGIELMRELLAIHPAAKVIIYSSQDERIYARRALEAGASGYIEKAQELTEVAAGVTAVCNGRLVFSATISDIILRDVAGGRTSDAYAGLSNRELQILRLLGHGSSSQEIAGQLSLSIKTIGTYRERLKLKLGLEDARALERAAHAYVSAHA